MLTCNKDEIPIGPPASCFLFGVLCDPGEVVQSRALRVGKVGRAESKRAVNCVKIRGPHLLSSVYNNRTKEVSDQIKFITLVGIKKRNKTDSLLVMSWEIKPIFRGRNRRLQICSHPFSNKVQKQRHREFGE